jgi:hypothetical protein
MAHVKINGKVYVDWETGSEDNDRRYLFECYSAFINEVRQAADPNVLAVFEKWNVSTGQSEDGFTRIFIQDPR